jgi:hypothetical protein
MEELACALQEFGFCTPLQYFTKISDTPEFKRNTFKKMIHSAKFSKKSEKKSLRRTRMSKEGLTI